MASITHYGVTMGLRRDSFPGCCGGSTIYGFTVSGNTSNLTLERKHKMYDALFRSLGSFSGVVVALDCVLNFGEWEDLDRSGGTVDTSWEMAYENEEVGDISLEDFCIHHKFEITGHSVNQNSGNVVAAMIKPYRPANEEGSAGSVYDVPAPDFSDDEPPKRTAPTEDVAAVAAQLRELVARHRANV